MLMVIIILHWFDQSWPNFICDRTPSIILFFKSLALDCGARLGFPSRLTWCWLKDDLIVYSDSSAVYTVSAQVLGCRSLNALPQDQTGERTHPVCWESHDANPGKNTNVCGWAILIDLLRASCSTVNPFHIPSFYTQVYKAYVRLLYQRYRIITFWICPQLKKLCVVMRFYMHVI